MDEKDQQKNFDRVLFEKLLRARSEIIITAKEARRLAEVFSSYQKRYPLNFGQGMRKIERDWIL
jgi:hypothetical protein